MARFLPTLTASRVQVATYLFGIALFSITFLVFLNSSISFVVTYVIGQKDGVGNAVGTLGFADELLALVACPAWGLLSDRIGVRTVAVSGYCIVGISLFLLVQSSSVYPQLLLGRLLFSIGGAACSTMVTAVLPSMIARRSDDIASKATAGGATGGTAPADAPNGGMGHAGTSSVSSELTITPTRYSDSSRRGSGAQTGDPEDAASTSRLAGFVGLFTGAGALVALLLFLPLPAKFQGDGDTPASSIQKTFYIVGSVALAVAIAIFFGLRNLAGEEGKSLQALFRPRSSSATLGTTSRPLYTTLVRRAVRLGFTDSDIALGYLGGFVARASSVGISLFVPLFVNAYFVRSGLCTSNPDDLTDIRENCGRAYTLAGGLTGIAETAALVFAPVFGYVGGRMIEARLHWPLLTASLVGLLGYTGLGFIQNPDAFHGSRDAKWTIAAMIAIGISQIGAIVCSLALLGRGISSRDSSTAAQSYTADRQSAPAAESSEHAPLLLGHDQAVSSHEQDRTQLKGTIAGVYSLLGGAGILILTKVGGALFDSSTAGAPFFIMALFNALLLLAVVAVGIGRVRGKQSAESV